MDPIWNVTAPPTVPVAMVLPEPLVPMKSETRLAAVVEPLQPESVIDTPNDEKFSTSLVAVVLSIVVTVSVCATPVEQSVSVNAPVVEQPENWNEWLAVALVTFRLESAAPELAPTVPCRTPELVETVVFTARAFGPGGMHVSPPEQGRGGLALLLARGLVEAQKGIFRVESGDGLTVSFTLPAAKA